jgi:hypothetical protein
MSVFLTLVCFGFGMSSNMESHLHSSSDKSDLVVRFVLWEKVTGSRICRECTAAKQCGYIRGTFVGCANA